MYKIFKNVWIFNFPKIFMNFYESFSFFIIIFKPAWSRSGDTKSSFEVQHFFEINAHIKNTFLFKMFSIQFTNHHYFTLNFSSFQQFQLQIVLIFENSYFLELFFMWQLLIFILILLNLSQKWFKQIFVNAGFTICADWRKPIKIITFWQWLLLPY